MKFRQPTTKRLTYQAGDVEALKRKVGSVTIPPGSSGRIELQSKRVLGVCPVPLGPLMGLPLAGSAWASALAPTGAVITSRGGISNTGPDCDAFVEWTIPVDQAQGVRFELAPLAIVAVVVAIAGALALLGWAITKITLLIDAVVGVTDPTDPKFWGIVALGAGAIVILGMTGKRK